LQKTAPLSALDNPLASMYALLLGFSTAFSLTYLIIPVIIRVAIERRIYDRPNERSSHREPTPSLGGIALFAGTVCGTVLWTPGGSFGVLQYILAAFVLIFFVGILDDLLPISPGKKLAGQLLVAIILAYMANVRVTSFYGFAGIHDLSDIASLMLSIIAIVGIINAFNLIDGINGLAGSIGLLACLFFGTWFYLVDVPALMVVAFSLAGAILAFLKYNFTPAKIFMGDTGSLLIGTVCALLAISFIETNYKLRPESPYTLGAAPAIAVAVLILPLYDTLTVLTRRILRGRSPFSPDKTHVHHQLLLLGLSHTATTATLLCINVLFILAAFLFNRQGIFTVLVLELILAIVLSGVLYLLSRLTKS
jgi:UDP-N-acetylmuramyl pentapeptide phosphotransferase/UDP-N-acetylglucosamine-1-phosphate transferase